MKTRYTEKMTKRQKKRLPRELAKLQVRIQGDPREIHPSRESFILVIPRLRHCDKPVLCLGSSRECRMFSIQKG